MRDLFTISSSALPDATRVAGFRGTEGISRPYEFDMYLLLGPEGQDLDLADAVGAKAKLTIDRGDGRPPFVFHGIFAAFELLRELGERSVFHATLVPQLWQLTQTFHSRIFTNKTIPDILQEVLEDGGLGSGDYVLRLGQDYKPQEHVCQYAESHFDFISRWMEREGMYYYFEQGDAAEKLVITDSKSFQDALEPEPVRFFALGGYDVTSGEALHTFTCRHHALPASVKVRDYDYGKPTLDVSGSAAVSKVGIGEISVHGRRFFTPDDGKRLARLRAEELLARQIVYRGTGTALYLRAGYFFTLEDHPRPAFDARYLVTEVEHEGNQALGDAEMRALTGIETDRVYRVDVKAIPATVQFRAESKAAWPRIYSFENGVVCGPAESEYAQIDEHGRYHVKFKFDESDLGDGKASTWVRMIQPHGGNPEGWHFPLRKGTEVLFTFLGGDPDRPVIAGVVPNAHNPSPVTRTNHTTNVIQTGGLNRLEMEDRQGSQWSELSTPPQATYLFLGATGHRDHNFVINTQGTGLVHTGSNHDVFVDGKLHERVRLQVHQEFDDTKTTAITGAVTEEYKDTVTQTYAKHHQMKVEAGGRKEEVVGGYTQKIEGGVGYDQSLSPRMAHARRGAVEHGSRQREMEDHGEGRRPVRRVDGPPDRLRELAERRRHLVEEARQRELAHRRSDLGGDGRPQGRGHDRRLGRGDAGSGGRAVRRGQGGHHGRRPVRVQRGPQGRGEDRQGEGGGGGGREDGRPPEVVPPQPPGAPNRALQARSPGVQQRLHHLAVKTVKPQRLALLTKIFEDRAEAHLVVSALAFFSFDDGALISEAAMWKFAAEELGKDTALDLAMPKPRGEVLVTGKAFTFGGTPRPACSVRVRLGAVDKTLYVVGDRRWRYGIASDPEPFTEMPITWPNAFGGRDYPQNPLGKGLAPRGGEPHLLPNIEDPRRLVHAPGDRPPPAGFGPYDLTWPQRYAKIGTYDSRWLEDRYPGVAADFDPAFYNAAPLDQQMDGYLRGDEPFTLENLHPTRPTLEGRLPGVRARIFVNHDRTEIALHEVPMRAETVHLFPHAERGIVIFRGVVKVADDAGDVHHLLAAFEALDEPRPLEHYATVLAQRIDRKRAHLYALRDRDLLPAALAEPSPVTGEVEDLIADEGLLDANMRRGTERALARAHEQATAAMVKQGLAPPPPPPPLPPRRKVPDIDALPAFVEEMEQQVEKMRADMDTRFARASSLARDVCKQHDLDYEKVVGEQKAKGGGPPAFSAAARMEQLRGALARANAGGMALPDLEAQLADPSFEERLKKAETMLRSTYRLFAHVMTPAARLGGEHGAQVRAQIIAEREAGGGFLERDLTGVDLSHLDLRGVDFRLAFLERADLTGADLRGANLTAAVLARADLSGAKLSGAKLGMANLGAAKLDHADFSGDTDLTGAVLAKADLSHATFEGATLERVDLAGATFHETNFRSVVATQLTFLKSDLRGLSLAGADLQRSNFIESALDGVDCSGAVLASSIMLTVTGRAAVFRGADLTGIMSVKGSSFEGASFAGANLTRAQLRGTRLDGADFSEARLDGADLSECDLRGANLEHATARGALFMKADLAGANLRRADLMEAILQRAKLHGTNLEGANLFRADLLKVDVDGGTITRGANLKAIRFVQAKAPDGQR